MTITAAQSGDTNYSAAVSVDQTFCINPSKPVITQSLDNSGNIVLASSNSDGNQWLLNGTPITSGVNSTFIVTAPGSYSVIITIEGCSSQLSNNLVIIVTGDILDPIRMSNSITIYPNPSNNGIYINLADFDINQSIYIRIIDLLGRSIITLESREKEVELIDISMLQSGKYLIEIKQSNRIYSGKFIKQ